MNFFKFDENSKPTESESQQTTKADKHRNYTPENMINKLMRNNKTENKNLKNSQKAMYRGRKIRMSDREIFIRDLRQ